MPKGHDRTIRSSAAGFGAVGFRTALTHFRDALADVSRTFARVESQFAESVSIEKGNYTQDLQRLGDEFQQIHDQISAEYFAQLESARVRYEQAVELVSTQENSESIRLTDIFRTTTEQAESDLESAKVRQIAGYEDAQRQRKLRYREQLTHCEQYRKELNSLITGVAALMRRRGTLPRFTVLRAEKGPDTSTERLVPNPLNANADTMLAECSRSATQAAELMHTIERWSICRFADDGWPILVGIFLVIAMAVPAIIALGWTVGSVTALVTAIVGSVASLLIAHQRGRALVVPYIGSLVEFISQAERSLAIARSESQLETRADLTQLHRQHDDALHRLDADLQRTRQNAQRILDTSLATARTQADTHRKKLEDAWNAETNPIRQRYLPILENRQSEYEQTLERRRAEHQQNTEVLKAKYDANWRQLADHWQSCWDDWIATIQAMNQYRADKFLPWDAPETTRAVSHELLPAIAFGDCRLGLEQVIAQPLPNHSRLRVPQHSFSVPAFLAIPDEASLLLQAKGDGRSVAVGALRNVLLRFIQSVPPGKFRLTIIDPTGLGQNFSELMHLADFDERLVRSRIWTEPTHIQQRLVDLTEHMENVIQKYLRNDYATIQEYNERAGEVAEPFQILAIANFPANFTEEAAQRLIRIVSAGTRCGVFTIMSSDSQLALPRNFDLSDLKRHANTLEWNEDRHAFEWCDAMLRPWDVQLEQPPSGEQINRMVRNVGQLAVEYQRVEVPFRKVMPAGAWWQSDCAEQLEVPIGRVGATRLQHLTLGRGTSQHVLMAGKTGSGKSTLLHALITNAALHYSPAQLQFYLIDFKKGVEFKAYARYRLPHARVIAIESEREFGLSVLERLDAELRTRGDRFRELGVQDLAAFRRACSDPPTPRILLVIDEFQEFFVKEDKIAQSAALLLDRLVRQGRAFGIHVLLGSQTLSGAYSLARSTIGQMAVRIALQCSETDAHMILSEDNDAARLLSRPGQAIYNDANGLFEGNHPFQVVWLTDDERRDLLQRLQQHARDSDFPADLAPMIFEGNVAADPRDNNALMRGFESPASGEMPLAPQAWLGSPIAIGPPPAAVLRRQSGNNLLLVGQSTDLAIATLAQSLLGLMSFSPRSLDPDDRFQCAVLALHADDPDNQLWQTMSQLLPGWLTLHAEATVSSLVDMWEELVTRRIATGQDRAAARFLVVPRLARFRELQGNEADAAFASFSPKADQARTTAQKFQKILKDGPSVGVHTLLWCDQLHDLHRGLGRGMLSELNHRILFPMNASDSSQLMDSPEATRLGPLRAIYYRSDIGTFEKLRPFATPDEDWLRYVAEALQRTDFLPTRAR